MQTLIPLLEWLGTALLHFAWQGAVIALVAFLALASVPRTDSSARHAIGFWALCLSLLSFFSTLGYVVLQDRVVSSADVARALAPVEMPLDVLVATFSPASSAPGLRAVVSMLWIGGVLLMTLRLGRGHAWARGLRRGALPPEDPAWQRIVDSLCAQVGLSRSVMLLQSERIESPAVVGWWRPVIVVPLYSLTGLTPEQLRCVLAHELAHIRRRDHLVNALLVISEICLFFHPATWLFIGLVRKEREHCCDLAAVRLTGSPRLLAEALTELESIRISGPVPALAARAEGGPLMQRITRILAMNPMNNSRDRMRQGGRRVRTALLLASALSGLGLTQTVLAEPAAAAAPEWSVSSHDDAAAEYKIIERRVLAAVKGGHLSKKDAMRTLDAVARAMKMEQRDARAKVDRDDLAARIDKLARIDQRLEAAVRSGQITKEEANEKRESLRIEMFPMRDPLLGTDSEAGRVERYRDARFDYESELRQLNEAAEYGKLSRDDAASRYEALNRVYEGIASRAGEVQGDRRDEYQDAANKLRDAVDSGRLSALQARLRLHELRDQAVQRQSKAQEEYRRRVDLELERADFPQRRQSGVEPEAVSREEVNRQGEARNRVRLQLGLDSAKERRDPRDDEDAPSYRYVLLDREPGSAQDVNDLSRSLGVQDWSYLRARGSAADPDFFLKLEDALREVEASREATAREMEAAEVMRRQLEEERAQLEHELMELRKRLSEERASRDGGKNTSR